MTHVLVMLVGVIGGAVPVYVVMQARRAQQAARLAAELNEEGAAAQARLEQERARLAGERKEFEGRVVSYAEFQEENRILKRDLQNIDVTVRKLELDRDLQREAQQKLDERSRDLGSRYLKESVNWISSSLTPNNFVNCKDRLQKVIEWCRGIGFEVPAEEQGTLLDDIRKEFEAAVRAAFEREEQARIKARIREEQMLEKEVEREIKQLERERAAIQAALDKALQEARDQHSEEIERLRSRLAEAEEKSQRAISQAQMTKAGHVYVISNIGSFGEGVYKIGVTRRLEPSERIRELGDASVPFPFDVHMMITSDDALSLENVLHRTLHKSKINKIKPRKEFFKTDIEAVRRIVEEHHGEVQYVADAEALQYRQSLAMSEEDQEYIEHVYDELDEQSKPVGDDQ